MDTTTLIISLAGLTGTGIAAFAGLTAWHGWLSLKHAELEKVADKSGPANSVNTRIEIADLKERLRKLEAIAAGVDL